MRQDRRGFTLIELLIVVVILGILATIAISEFGEARKRAFVRVVQTDLRNLAVQQEIYHHINGVYAGNPGPPDFVKTPDVIISINENTQGGWAATASHPGWTTGKCGIYVGNAQPSNGDSGNPEQVEGSVYCWP